MATQRRSISAVCGYSSLSIMFLSAQSAISVQRLRLHPGGHERGQVEPGAAVEQQLVLDQLVGDVGRHRPGRQLMQRRADPALEGGVRRAQEGIGLTGLGVPSGNRVAVQRHGGTLPQRTRSRSASRWTALDRVGGPRVTRDRTPAAPAPVRLPRARHRPAGRAQLVQPADRVADRLVGVVLVDRHPASAGATEPAAPASVCEDSHYTANPKTGPSARSSSRSATRLRRQRPPRNGRVPSGGGRGPGITEGVVVSRRRPAVTRFSPRHTLALALVAVLAAAGVGTAVLLPRTPAPTGTPAAGPPLSAPPAAPAGSPARPLDDSFLDGDDDPVPTTPRTVDVADAGALTDALGTVRGGTTLVLADGTYDGDFTVRGVSATPEAPVVVRAANPGKAVVGSGSTLVVKGSAHVVVAGLTFRSGASTLLKLESSNNVRVTHTTFDRGGVGEGSSKWLYIGGADSHHNRIDHNSFLNKTDPGNYLTLDGSKTQVSQYDRIDHNRFARIGPRAENEKEAVRLGWSDISLSSGFTMFEDNCWRSATATRRS